MPVYTCNNGERTILHPTTYDVCAACFVRYPRLRVGIRVGVGVRVRVRIRVRVRVRRAARTSACVAYISRYLPNLPNLLTSP